MKIAKLFCIGSAVVSLLSFSCSGGGELVYGFGKDVSQIDEWTVEVDFSKTPDSTLWHTANGYGNGDMFNCCWMSDHVSYSNGQMIMKMDNQANKGYSYTSGEFRSNNKYGYGYYEVTMKPCKASGTNSSFFLYTGPSNGDPWDEIDIEFLGKDTSIVQFNYFVGGEGGHEYICNLGFDASKEFHTYGIEYQKGVINWYVDGKKVYTAKSGTMPSHKMQVMANFWPGASKVDYWLGPFKYTTPLYAYYDRIRFVEY